jgi:hypothetical protein
MPKKKQKRKPQNAALVAQTESTQSLLKKRVIKWASITVILAILLSVMIAAISASPSSAATPAAACVAQDTDGDAITNDVDSDIDGDGTVNGLDTDIDGDGIVNEKDGDPAATNCNDNGPLPILPEPTTETDDESNLLVRTVGVIVVAGLGIGYLVLRRIRGKKN